MRIRAVARQLALAGAAVATIAVAAEHIDPVFLGTSPLVQQLVQRESDGGVAEELAAALELATWQDSAAVRAPWAREGADSALGTPQFASDRAAFAADLMRTGRVSRERADELATYAVREAYRQRIPPALVFGVMMTENAKLTSTARSNVGAVGLMQIYPKYWVGELGKRFGTNLRNDETNLQYGVHILRHFVYASVTDWGNPDDALRKGLLRYNGCVRGTNTPRCHTYPDKVKTYVETLALAQCAEGFEACVEKPLRLSLDDATLRW